MVVSMMNVKFSLPPMQFLGLFCGHSFLVCLSASAKHRASNGWLDSPSKAPSKFQGTDKKLRSEELKEGDSSIRIKSLIRNQFSPSALLHPEGGQSVGGWLIISGYPGNY